MIHRNSSVSIRSLARRAATHFFSSARYLIPAVLATIALSNIVRADITGFQNFTLKRSDTGTPPVLVDADTIQFTTGPNQRRSLWFNTRQDISEFTATFTYRANGIGASGNRQGLVFVMQNDTDGINTLGDPVGGLFGNSGLGYFGIQPSAAVTVETDTGPARTFTGFYSGGVFGGGSAPTFPVNAFDGSEIDVTITYDGSILSVGMVEGSNVFPTRNYLVGSLEDAVGSSSAYIGFTASTANGGANQYISDFQYKVPEPSSALLTAVGIGALIGGRYLKRKKSRAASSPLAACDATAG